MKYKVNDIVKVYSGHATMPDGALGIIMDRDLADKSYLISLDMERRSFMLADYGEGVWVSEDDCEVISFERPKGFLQKIFPKEK